LGYILLKVSSFFQARSWHLGNIHPKNIMIDKDGMVRVFTTFSSPAERENCELVKESKYNDAYLGIGLITQLLNRPLGANRS
jgi:hypothetical protein